MMRVSRTSQTPDYDAFCALLKKLREEKGLTQTALADRLKVPQSFVSKYETGERRLDFIETIHVCAALGFTMEKFVKAHDKFIKAQGGRIR